MVIEFWNGIEDDIYYQSVSVSLGTGMVTKTTLDNTTTGKLVAMVSGITDQAKSVVRDLDPINDLRFLRLRSNKTEILIAPGKNISSRN